MLQILTIHVHLATCAYTKTQVEVLIVLGEAVQHLHLVFSPT